MTRDAVSENSLRAEGEVKYVGRPDTSSGTKKNQRHPGVFAWIAFVLALWFLCKFAALAPYLIPFVTGELMATEILKTISMAEWEYRATYPSRGYACSLAALGTDATSNSPTPQAAGLLPSNIANGHNSGYAYQIRDCKIEKIDGADKVTGFTVTAVPEGITKKISRGFCMNESAIIKVDRDGGANCR
jgi:type IV pilus assembly protein PilA